MEPLRIWFDPPHVRWGRVAVTVLIVTGLVGLWVAQRRGMFDAAPAAVVASASAAPASAPAVAIGPVAAVSAVTVAAAAPVPARAASSAEFVCGLGAVSFDPQDEKQVEALSEEAFAKLEAYRAKVLPGWQEEMKEHPDEAVQAVAWLSQAVEFWRTKVLPASEEKGNPWAKQGLQIDGLDELARLAQRSASPKVYAMAMNACGFLVDFSPSTSCAALSFEDWARRDPDNGYPWLLAANYQPKGSPRRAELIERAMAAKEARAEWGFAYEPLAQALAASASPLDRSAIYAEAAALGGIQMMPPVAAIEHCSEDELRKGNRRSRCENLASFLAERSDSPILSRFGTAIGRNLGWSQDRLNMYRIDLEAVLAAAPREQDLRGCNGLATLERYLADVAKHGELGAMRRRHQAALTAGSAATR